MIVPVDEAYVAASPYTLEADGLGSESTTMESAMSKAAITVWCAEKRDLATHYAIRHRVFVNEHIEELVSMWPRAGEMLKSVVSTRGLSAWSLPQDGVAGAAFALREREIREHDQHQERQRRIGAACKSGDTWVVLDENGKIDSGLSDPYRCTEMHVASGLAVMSLVQPDPSLGTAIFVVTVIKLDPLTGELLDADPGIEDWVEHAHQEDFVAHREAVRDRISSGAIKDTQ